MSSSGLRSSLDFSDRREGLAPVVFVRESGDRLGLITRGRPVRVRARSSAARPPASYLREDECGPELVRHGERSGQLSRGRIGFDGSVRQQCSSGSRPTALAQTGNRKCEPHGSLRVGSHVPRGVGARVRPGRRVTAPTWLTARTDELTRAGKDGALVEAEHSAPEAGRRHGCTAWSDAGSTPAGSTPTRPHAGVLRDGNVAG